MRAGERPNVPAESSGDQPTARAGRELTGSEKEGEDDGMTDDRIIDLRPYLEHGDGDDDDEEPPLALWGTEGDRRRFILPLWRMAFLGKAGWAGVVREDRPGALEVVVVVDQRHDPARPRPDRPLPELLADDLPPKVRQTRDGDLVLALGHGPRGRRWVVVLTDREPDAAVPEERDREDLLYLAGECAGLVELVER